MNCGLRISDCGLNPARRAAPTRRAPAPRILLPIRNPQSAIRNAFTLVELMVSIALVLILILGINAIFKMASDTINAGQALSTADRENRGAQGVLYNDFATGVFTDGPMLLIRSERAPAFRNREDELGDRDFAAAGANVFNQDLAIRTIDLDGNNQEGENNVPGEVTHPLVYNSRNHRIDRVAFFATHMYRRQTGSESSSFTRFIDDGVSNEAYIWYGHLDQPDFRTALTGSAGRYSHDSPGELPKDDNQNNFYATDWILGRSAILLRETPPPGQNYFDYQLPTNGVNLSPLEPGSESRQPANGVRDRMSWSRYDLAQTSIGAFRQVLLAHIARRGTAIDANDPVWYELLGGQWGVGGGNARFQGYPYPDRPLTPYGIARTVPVFVRGCTQFIVEYAGDYLAQNPNDGTIGATYVDGPGGTDGQIDFIVVTEKAHPNATARRARRIRWYGMPRNTDGWNDTAAGPVIAGAQAGQSDPNLMRDVVPLRDVIIAAGDGSKIDDPSEGFFEHFERLDPRPNYAALGAVDPDPKGVRYYAAWGPAELARGSVVRPKMIRITMTVDDPNGRMSEGQTYEYIIDLP